LPAEPSGKFSGDHFDAGGEQLLREAGRDAEAGRRVLAVGDAEIDLALRDDIREAVMHNFSSGRADNITDEEYFHSKGPISLTVEVYDGMRADLAERSTSPCVARP
jgi:hypothetical protein